MKTMIVLFLSLFLLASGVRADPVVRQYCTNNSDAVFAWDYDNAANPEVAGFTLYTRLVEEPDALVVATDISGPAVRSFKWVGFPDGQFIAYLTAYDRYGNVSDPSEWIQVNKWTVKPSKPGNNRVSGATLMITIQGE